MSNFKGISKFSFFSMTASLFVTVYEYPTFARYGKTSIFFLVLCGILWFLPLSLCSAELAGIKGYQNGGIFSWVGNPLGKANGFAAIFFQWFQVTVGFVTMIYFIIGTAAYIFKIPSINSDPVYKFISVVGIFWILTFLQFKGTKITTNIAKYGFSIGIVFPVCVMLVATIIYLFRGNGISTNFSRHAFLPNFENISALSTFLLAYMGVEASATHISNLKNSNKSYPKILIYLVLVGIITSSLGGSIVSIVLPGYISSNEGVMDAIQLLLSPRSTSVPVIIMGLLIIFGITAQVSSWIVSPTEGLQYTAQRGIISKKFANKNDAGVPINILMLQGAIVTIWAALLTFGSGGALSFQIAISLTVLIYLSAYVLLFASYFKVTVSDDRVIREFQMPGGKIFKVLVSAVGFIVSVLAIITTFFPPKSIPTSEKGLYCGMLGIAYAVVLIIPYLIFYVSEKK